MKKQIGILTIKIMDEELKKRDSRDDTNEYKYY